MAEHTVKAFDRELDSVGRAVVRLGAHAQTMVSDALDALIAGDAGLAQEAVFAGVRLGELQRDLEDEAILTIARRAPVAHDLRDVVAALRIAADLGRVGRHAESVARHTIRIGTATQVPRAVVGLRHLRALAADLLGDALKAYRERDAALARSVWERDADLDTLEGSVFGDLLSQMIEDPRSITYCTHVLAAAKAIERIGDHATNVAETVIYLVTGSAVVDERPRGRGAADIALDVAADEL